jgi:hypothetical protein
VKVALFDRNTQIENSSRNSNKFLLGTNYFFTRFKGAESRLQRPGNLEWPAQQERFPPDKLEALLPGFAGCTACGEPKSLAVQHGFSYIRGTSPGAQECE